MPRRQTLNQKRLSKALLTGQTTIASHFKQIVIQKKRPFNIISQGDSWFAYPRELEKWQNANIMDHLIDKLYGKANFLRLEENGAEAEDRASSVEFYQFQEALKVDELDFVLLSMGGNDYAGNNIRRHIKESPEGDADDVMTYIDADNVEITGKEIESSFIKHIEAVRLKHPNTPIMTHTYDYFKPSKRAAEILWGLLEISGPWVSIGMKTVPQKMKLPIVEWLMDQNKTMLQSLAMQYDNFHVVDTLGTLRPGNRTDWTNEIHPTPTGFRRIFKKLYSKMVELNEELPSK